MPRGLALVLTTIGLVAHFGVPSPAVAASADVPSPFVVHDLKGTAHDLGAELSRGRAVALVFWQTWCKACAKEAPAVVAAARAHRDVIQFVGVVSGPDRYVDDAEVARVAGKWGYTFPQVRDHDLALARRFGVAATPMIVVLGSGGQVGYRGRLPPDDWIAAAGVARR